MILWLAPSEVWLKLGIYQEENSQNLVDVARKLLSIRTGHLLQGAIELKNTGDATSSLDRAFTLFFIVTSIMVIPTLNNLLSNITTEFELLRTNLYTAIIGSIMIVIAVYGFAVLLNVQWLRFVGFYGLFCIFFRSWIMFSSSLSANPSTYVLIFFDQRVNYLVNLLCIPLMFAVFYVWKKRNELKLEKSTYYLGAFASYTLFLVFGFFQNLAPMSFSGIIEHALYGILLSISSSFLFIFLLGGKIGREILFYITLFNFVFTEFIATINIVSLDLIRVWGPDVITFFNLTSKIGVSLSLSITIIGLFLFRKKGKSNGPKKYQTPVP
jgi:hypothetical protein